MERVCGQAPPLLMIVGDRDPITPVSIHEQMRDAIIGKGGRAELVVLPGVGHVFGYGVETDAQKQTFACVEPFLKAHLLDG